MPGYNLSSNLEQVTTGSRVPENGNPPRVPGSWERGPTTGSGFLGTGTHRGFRIPGNGEPARISSHRFFSARVPKKRNPPEFRVPRNLKPTVDFAFPGS